MFTMGSKIIMGNNVEKIIGLQDDFYLDRFEYSTKSDQFFNYCMWDYQPVSDIEDKYRQVNLLFYSFSLLDVDQRAYDLVENIRNAIGPFRTVWGIKWCKGRLAWEFYFYDYKRLEREISITHLLEAIQTIIPCEIQVNENLPYFMFSLDISDALISGKRKMDSLHMYIGNPGSTVSSGISYQVTKECMSLENFYFFFDAKRDLQDLIDKIYCSAHIDATQIDINKILYPELIDCKTICIANKKNTDTVYFSGVTVKQLLYFLKMLEYPIEVVKFVEENESKLDHFLYDVGFDYMGQGSDIKILKSGYYGIF